MVDEREMEGGRAKERWEREGGERRQREGERERGGGKEKVVVTSSPHIVQVVSMLEAPRRLGSVSFQSKEVRGAQNSEFLFCKWTRERERERDRDRERERINEPFRL